MKTFRTLVIAVMLSIIASISTHAQNTTTDIPKTISYQGMINAPDGAPLADGQYTITVSFYADANGMNRVWQGTYPATVTKGIFNVMLGGGASPFTDTKMFNQPLWVGIKVSEGEEMRPLTQLSSAPSALGIPDSSVTAAKMGTNYVAGITVNGTPITGVGSTVNLVGAGSTSLLYDQQTNSIIVNAGAAATNGDTANKNGSFKGNGAGTDAVGAPAIEGVDANGHAALKNYVTEWSTNSAGGSTAINNTSITDDPIAKLVTVNNGAGLAVAEATISEIDGTINSINGTYQIGGSTVVSIKGTKNTLVGVGAGAGITTGTNNSAFGFHSLNATTTGSDNTAVGVNALLANATGSSNTALGFGADVSANNLSNATAIGNGAVATANNLMQLGNTSVTSVVTAGTLTTGMTSAGTTGSLIFNDGTAAGHTTTFKIGSQAGNISYTLPTAQASAAGQVLANNGAGVLSWTSNGVAGVTATAPVTSTGGANPVIGLNINPALIVAAGNLDINTGHSNTWTVAQTFNGPLQVGEHILSVGPNDPIKATFPGVTGGSATDVSGKVSFQPSNSLSGCQIFLYIPVTVAYINTDSVSVVVTGDSCNSAALMPFGQYTPGAVINGVVVPASIVIGSFNPPLADTKYKFDYHVIENH